MISLSSILFETGSALDVDSITQRPTLLMCPATYFDIEQTEDSNPMERKAVDRFIQRRQWVKGEARTQNNALAALYKNLGANPLDMVPDPELRDQIFTTDTSHFIIRAKRNADGAIYHD